MITLCLGLIAWFLALSATMMAVVAAVWLLLVLLPVIIAFRRHARSRWLILLLSLILGHTGILWIVALIWACVGEVEPRFAGYGVNS